MESSLQEPRSFLKPFRRGREFEWESPYLLNKLFKNCEVEYRAQAKNPEALFTEYELVQINLVLAGALYRFQKITHKDVAAQVVLLKDGQQTFAEMIVEFVSGPNTSQVHSFIQKELRFLKRKFPHLLVAPSFEWGEDLTRGINKLSYQLRFSS